MLCLKNCKKEINENNIWKDDLFDRKIVADDFSRIVTSITQPFVLSVDAPYGSGKSFFLERWKTELSQNEEITVFFNAWSCDFVKNPLVPFMYNFLGQLKEQGVIEETQKAELGNALNSVLINALKVGTYGIIDLQEMTKEQVSKNHGLSGFDLNEYKIVIENIKTFKEKVSEAISKTKNENKNIYVFVDELERCRPTFAVKLLESIKHLFDIEGLVFILGIDRSQLKTTISNIYGAGMDGEGYLRRFIDLELQLPEPDRNKFIQMLCKQFEIENKEQKYIDDYNRGYNVFNKYFKLFAGVYGFSLRDTEQCYTEFNIITKTLPEDEPKMMALLAFLIVLKYKDNEFYSKLGSEYKKPDEIIDILNKKIKPSLNFDNRGHMYQKWQHFLATMVAVFEIDMNGEMSRMCRELNEKTGDDRELRQRQELYQDAAGILRALGLETRHNRHDLFDKIKNKLIYTSSK